MADGHGSGHALSCQVCGVQFQQSTGRGRPRKRCEGCVPPRPGQRHQGDRSCIECGTAIKRGTRKQLCSPECRSARTKRLVEIRIRASGVQPRKQMQARTCVHCSISFIRHSSKGRDVGLYCGRPCSFAAMRERRLAKEALAPSPVDCVVCGYRCERVGARCCSSECAKRLGRLRYQATPLPARPCACCGIPFVPLWRRMGPLTYCSGICRARSLREQKRKARRVRRARERAGGGDSFDPLDVLRRDGWRCYLCGKDTPQKLRGSYHPDAPELDHVIPVSKGGQHTTGNTRCACRACNQVKSDRLIAA